MGMGIGMLALQCAVEYEYRWNVGLHNVRLTSFQLMHVMQLQACSVDSPCRLDAAFMN